MLWISRGDADIPQRTPYGDFHIATGSGVLVTNGSMERAEHLLEPFKGDLMIEAGKFALPFQRNLLWDMEVKLEMALLPVGFGLLDVWDLAVPLCDYKTLAVHIGSEEEQEKTKAVIRDLRVPVYDVRLMFAKYCQNTVDLFTRWQKECIDDSNERLAFLRALYAVKPLILALPSTWTTGARA